MKVLLIRNAFTYDFGGAERLPVHFAHELIANKIDATVLSRQPRLLDYAKAQDVPHLRGWWWSKQNWSGANVLLFPVYVLWQVVLTIWYLRLLASLKPDAVHILSKDDFIAGTLAAKMLGRPVVWTDAADLKHVFRNHKVWYKNPVGKLVYRVSKLANHVTLVSRSEKDLIEESLGGPCPGNFVVMHIAGKDESVTAMKRDKKDEGSVIFCATSRLVIAKGIGELVEAFNKLSEGSDKYRLWLVGDGPDEAMFKKQAGDNPNIVFWGHTEKPLPYLAASDIYVHPTHHEAFSLSLTEAAMLGKPMIATNVGGNPELVNEGNGLLVPLKDAGSLAEAMKRLGDDKNLLKKMGENARRDYVNNFDFRHIIKTKFIPLYEPKQKN